MFGFLVRYCDAVFLLNVIAESLRPLSTFVASHLILEFIVFQCAEKAHARLNERSFFRIKKWRTSDDYVSGWHY